MSVLKMKRQLAKIGICKITKEQEDSLDKAEYEDTLVPLTEKLKNDLLATPKADASRLQALLVGAGQDAKIPNYAVACKKLAAKDVRKIYAEELGKAKGGSKEALKEAEYKAKYHKKRSTTEQQLEMLKALPGTETVRAQIEQKLLNAASLAETSPTQYEKACGQLDNSSKLATEAAKASNKAVEAVQGSKDPAFAAARQAMGQVETLLEEIEVKVPAEEAQKYWVEYTQILDIVCKTDKKGKPTATSEERNSFVQKIAPLKQKLERRRDEMNGWADKYAEEVRKLNTKLLEMTPFSTEMFLAPFHERLKQAETLNVQQRVDQAFAVIKDDMAELRAKAELWGPARNLWTKQLFDIAEPIKNGIAKMKNCPATIQQAIECKAELDRLTAMANDEKEDNYALASAAVVELKKSVDKHLETVTAFATNRQACIDADGEVQAAIVRAQTQLTAAQKKMVAAGGPSDAQVGESNKLLADIKTAWNRDVAVAVSVDDLDKPGTLQTLADIAGELERLAGAHLLR